MRTSIDTVPLAPKSIGQEIGETSKTFPMRGRVGKTVIEAAVDHKIIPNRIRYCPTNFQPHCHESAVAQSATPHPRR